MEASEVLPLAGLVAPASITVDRWGIPHLRAEHFLDLFLVQGFNAARDRLWQLDLWRKRGLGLLARDFGPGYLEQDRSARLFSFPGTRALEGRGNPPDRKATSDQFVAGFTP